MIFVSLGRVLLMMNLSFWLANCLVLPSEEARPKTVPCINDRPPCFFKNPNTTQQPAANEYGTYNIEYSNQTCSILRRNHTIQDVTIIGEDANRVLIFFSKGIMQTPPEDYLNKIYMKYNLECLPGNSMYINFSEFEIEDKTCGTCSDYLRLELGASGFREFCGSDIPSPFFHHGSSLTAIFQSSASIRDRGFIASAICLNPSPLNGKNSLNRWSSLSERNRYYAKIVPKGDDAKVLDYLINAMLEKVRENVKNRPLPTEALDITVLPWKLTTKPRIFPFTPRLKPVNLDPLPKFDHLHKKPSKLLDDANDLKRSKESGFSNRAAYLAVANVNSLNSIVRAAAKAIESEIKKSDPQQLKTARIHVNQNKVTVPAFLN